MSQGKPRADEGPAHLVAGRRFLELVRHDPTWVDRLNRLSHLVCTLLKAPVAQVNVVLPDRQVSIASVGQGEGYDSWSGSREAPLSASYCQHVLATGEPLMVRDATTHPLVKDNEATTEAGIRAYAAVPLKDEGGETLATLCVVDFEARSWDADDLRALAAVADLLMDEAHERIKAEAALARSEVRFRSLVENVEDLIAVLTSDLHVVYGNPAFGRLLGYRPEEIEGRLFVELVHPDDLEPWKRVFLRSLQLPGGRSPAEWRMRHADGGWRWVQGAGVNLVDDPAVQGLVLNLRDVTQRRRAEEALRRSEERYRSLFDSMDEGFFLVEVCCDEDGRPCDLLYREANAAATRMVGGDWTGRYLSEIDPAFESYWYEIFGSVIQTGEAVRMERYAAPMDAWYSFSVFRIGGPESRLAGNVFQDITEEKRAEQTLRESEASLRQLSQTLEERVEERTREVRELAEALAAAEQEERQRLSYLLHDDVQQLLYSIQMKLEVARHEAGRQNVEAWRLNTDRSTELLGEAIRRTRQLTVDMNPPVLDEEDLLEAVDWLRTQMRDLYDLEVDVHAREAVSIANPERRLLLFQVTRELLFNVAKHAGTGRAMVEIDVEEGRVRVSVSDDGPGFDPGSILSKPRRRSGLGLLRARERLRMHGGDLEIRSAPGEGARVAAYAPVGME